MDNVSAEGKEDSCSLPGRRHVLWHTLCCPMSTRHRMMTKHRMEHTATSQTNPRRSWARRRFTLAEVVVATGLLALTTSGVYSGIIVCLKMIASARYHQEAQTVAVDRAWLLLHEGYEDLVNYESPGVEIVPASSPLNELGGTFRCAVLNHSDHCEIIVRVDWNEKTAGGVLKSPYVTASVRRYNTIRR